jgi:AbrB family looped-hinge helix DNA binding protein
MSNAIEITIDASGRLVLPKAVREEVGILPGMTLRVFAHEGRIELEPVPREVRIVEKGPLLVAVPVEPGEPLSEDVVDRTLREIRERDLG